MWHKGTGVIQYDPPRGRMTKKVEWWCVINIDTEITRYYRWWIEKELHIKGLFPPSWDAHISIIRGEKPYPEKMDLWKKYDGETVEFRYEHSPHRGKDRPELQGTFWNIEIDCSKGIEIRKEFGFKYDWPLHLTFGRTWF